MSSYLDFPRINFAGQFRADTSTRNNCPCNYKLPTSPDNGFNPLGTGEFYIDAKVTSVVYKDGTYSTQDPIVNSPIVNNINMTPAKMVDLDPDNQLKSTVYGVQMFMFSDAERSNVVLEGKWIRHVTMHNIWTRVFQRGGDSSFSANGFTRLEDIKWGDFNESLAINQMKEVGYKALSVRTTLYSYMANSAADGNFTFGYIVGTIGLYKEGEPLNAGGERQLSYRHLNLSRIAMAVKDNCGVEGPFIRAFKAPFQVKEQPQTGNTAVISVDLSNTLAMQEDLALCNLGQLQFAVVSQERCCIDIIGQEINYLEEGWLQNTGGIVDMTLETSELDMVVSMNLTLVVVSDEPTIGSNNYEICGEGAMMMRSQQYAEIILQEVQFFIRPLDYYVFRLQRTFQETATFEVLVTNLGKPESGIPITLINDTDTIPSADCAFELEKSVVETNSSGVATFQLKLNASCKIPYPREYGGAICSEGTTIDVDGQSFEFLYNLDISSGKYVSAQSENCRSDIQEIKTPLFRQIAFCSNALSILIHSDPLEFNYTKPYTWIDHVQPIFQQYYHLYPVMSSILNLSDYSSVTQIQNLNLLKFAMSRSLDDPKIMPVTRDLSPLKTQMILDWLDSPLLGSISNTTIQTNTTCQAVSDGEMDLTGLCPANTFGSSVTHPSFSFYSGHAEISNPTEQWQFDAMNNNCTLESLKLQLQQAVELEFATIPLYMTTLYSIAPGCNTEAYGLIRSVLLQEMLHMSQSANILIALGGRPVIDSDGTAPSYPTTGLPGGVLPNLNIALHRASRAHLNDTLMAIEFPHETDVARDVTEIMNSTIGLFYQQVNNCMSSLTDQGIDLFGVDTSHLQLRWPWPNNATGELHVIRSLKDAQEGVLEIIEQGEGASPIDPDFTRNELAHFYKFEEIVCTQALVKVNDTHYAYEGDPIGFDTTGIYPMRDNPSKNGIEKGTQAYYEARAFHRTYRNLLGKLQQTFDGEPDMLIEAVSIMESLLVHSRRVMRTKLENSDETVGPVFDYEWED